MFDLNGLGLNGSETIKRHVSATGHKYDMMSAFAKLSAQAAAKFGHPIGISHVGNSQAFSDTNSKESITVVVGPDSVGSERWQIIIDTVEIVKHVRALGTMVYAYDYEEHYIQSRVLCMLLDVNEDGQCKVKLNNGNVVYFRHYKKAC